MYKNAIKTPEKVFNSHNNVFYQRKQVQYFEPWAQMTRLHGHTCSPVPFETMVNIQNMKPTVKSYRVHHLER